MSNSFNHRNKKLIEDERWKEDILLIGKILVNTKDAVFIRNSDLDKWTLAKMFNVNERTIRNVKNFKTYL